MDTYSSTTPIPYVLTGLLNGSSLFSVSAVQPNTFGAFVTVVNPSSGVLIDTLLIELSNPATACCGNPVGFDNVAVIR